MTSGLRDLLRRAPRWLVIVAAVYGPLVMGVGVWLFVTSLNAHTETVSARVSTDYAGRSSYVDFKFAETAPTANTNLLEIRSSTPSNDSGRAPLASRATPTTERSTPSCFTTRGTRSEARPAM